MTEVGREALHAARERVDPIEQRVFGAFSAKETAAFRGLLSRFIEAFEDIESVSYAMVGTY